MRNNLGEKEENYSLTQLLTPSLSAIDHDNFNVVLSMRQNSNNI
jgi:hypothetical protein